MKYTAINIGPIITTLGMTKRPRELWSASYLFSHLMRCIVESLPEDRIISPATLNYSNIETDKTIGLYPDRVFVEGDINPENIAQSVNRFADEVGISRTIINDYFNVMHTSVEVTDVKTAVHTLNKMLDCLELNKQTTPEIAENKLIELIGKKYDSPLFNISRNSNEFPIESLGEIGAYNLKGSEHYSLFKKQIQSDTYIGDPYKAFGKDYKSYHKYVCIVQADGDNMGKIVSNTNEIKDISNALLSFGQSSCETIKTYGGLPIYAGGDDLLFIAPVVGKDGKTIFNLLEDIDSEYASVQSVVDNKHTSFKTSMSYGLSITYYKFPLYESLNAARNLLFDVAKKVDGKNAIAWNLQKHSGSSFAGKFSKNDTQLYAAFKSVIKNSPKDTVVSAVSHKLRESEGLLSLWIGKKHNIIEMHVSAFFNKVIDIEGSKKYKESAKELLLELYKTSTFKETDGETETHNSQKASEELTKTIYGMLRTAKFINGEEDDK